VFCLKKQTLDDKSQSVHTLNLMFAPKCKGKNHDRKNHITICDSVILQFYIKCELTENVL
jgi:hypothetical protein